MREPGVQVEQEPEWNGPDPLIEMARKARRMVPASKVTEAVAAERARITREVEGLEPDYIVPQCDCLIGDPCNHEDRVSISRAAVLAIINQEDTDAGE